MRKVKLFVALFRGAILLCVGAASTVAAQAGQNPFVGDTVDTEFVYVTHTCDPQSCWDGDPIHERQKIFVGKHGGALQYNNGASGLMLPLGKLVRYHMDGGPNQGKDYSFMVQLSGDRLVYVNFSHSTGNYTKYIFTKNALSCNLDIENDVHIPEDAQYHDNINRRYQMTVTQLACKVSIGPPAE